MDNQLQAVESLQAPADTIVPAPDMPYTPQAEAPEEQAAAAPTPEESKKEMNFRAFRQAAMQAAKERDEALQKAAQYEKMLASMQGQPQQANDYEDDFHIAENDDLVDSKKLAEFARHQRKQIQELKKQNKAILEQTRSFTGESRFMSENPDWSKVMTQENIQALSMAYPECARVINSSSDVYDKAKATYTFIKQMGIYEEHPYEAEKNKALANSLKPKPLTSISPQQGDTPLSRKNAFEQGLTPDLKDALRKEMAAAIRRR